MRTAATIVFALSLGALSPLRAEDGPYSDPLTIPEVRNFLAAGGLGSAHAQAPEELAQFGRLVGIWDAQQEVRAADGSWVPGAPALWVWKYTLGGFATQDLWLHTTENLPSYLASLGRPYMLTGLRIFEVSSGQWRVAWAANGAGQSPGADFGTFDAPARDNDMVLEDESSFGKQRVTFSDITDDSFVWTSEYSRDGDTWMAVMRVTASRRAGIPNQ
jgi:hypothetical protein